MAKSSCVDGSSPLQMHTETSRITNVVMDAPQNIEFGEEENGEQTGKWAELTQEVLIDIFSKLDLEERWKNASLVCKSWFKACQYPFFWLLVDFEKCFQRRRETAVWWTPEFEKKIDKMVEKAVDCSGGKLRELHVRHCSDKSLLYLASRCPNIRCLSIKACQNVTDKSVCQIATGCHKIEELDISYCYNISCASLENIGANCKYLTTIKRNMFSLDPSKRGEIVPVKYINSAPLSGDEEAAVFVKFMPNLKHLEMMFSKLSSNGKMVLICGFRTLGNLNFSDD